MSRRLLFLLVALIAFYSRAMAAPIRVACLGDSLTAGAKVRAATEAYPVQLQALLGSDFAVKNFGRSGATLWHGGRPNASEQLPATREFSPDIAVVIFGANDVRSRDVDYWSHFGEFDQDLTELLENLLKLPSLKRVILCTPPAHTIEQPGMTEERRASVAERMPRIEEIGLKVREVARRYESRGVELLDLYAVTVTRPEVFNSDGVHFKAEGYRLLAESIAPRVEGWRPLFNGRDLTGWETHLGKPESESVVPGVTRDARGNYLSGLGLNRDPLQVFAVVTEDGAPALRISGEVFGTITSRASLSNYHLRLQFKWGQQRWAPRKFAVRDSGLLYHLADQPGESGLWPKSVEFQIQEQDCGDLITIGTRISVRARKTEGKLPSIYDPLSDTITFGSKLEEGVRCVRLEDYENPLGEWNTLELICLGDESIHVVNGRVVMRLAGARQQVLGDWTPLASGAIALQSEGAELFYRNIEVRAIGSLSDRISGK